MLKVEFITVFFSFSIKTSISYFKVAAEVFGNDFEVIFECSNSPVEF